MFYVSVIFEEAVSWINLQENRTFRVSVTGGKCAC